MLNTLDLLPRLDRLWEELLDDSYDVVQTKWAFQFKKQDERATYYPLICRICQDRGVDYVDCIKCKVHGRPLTKEHLLDHFAGRPFKQGSRMRGAIGISLCLKRGNDYYSKVGVIDFDSPAAVDVLIKKLVPLLKQMGLDYAVEHGPGDLAKAKCHLWLKFPLMKSETVGLFLVALCEKAGITEEERKQLKLEFFPHKKSYIRVFGGWHLTRSCMYGFNRKSKSYYQVTEIIDQFCEMQRIPIEVVNQTILENVPQKQVTDRAFRKKAVKKFKYLPKRLPIPEPAMKGITREMKLLSQECQAINGVINGAYTCGELGEESEHEPGLYLGGACMSLDKTGNKEDNEKWFNNILNQVRAGGAESAQGNMWTDPNRSWFAPCKKWNSLGYCKGCTLTNHDFFETPKQLLYGSQIRKTKIRDISPQSAEENRIKVIFKAQERIKHCIDNKVPLDMVIASFPSAGKSYQLDRMAVDMAKEGKNVLLAVHDGEAALQHKRRMEGWGVKPFVVRSFEGLFHVGKDGKRLLTDMNDCPDYTPIDRLLKLGISSKCVKKQFCGKCPFKDTCAWPGQYSRASDPKYNIVIIQHAHFSCRETLFTLLSEKNFDCLIVDEEFISKTFVEIKPNQEEIARLQEKVDNYDWLGDIVNWLTAGYVPDKQILLKEEDAECLKEFLESNNIPWNIPTYIQYFNAGHLFDKNRGLFVFYPIPDIPVRIFTDATPPIEMLRIVLDNENIEVYGKEEVLDYRVLNNDTVIEQVLDSSTSKSALAKDEYALFYEWLEYIGDDVRANHKGKKILITTYQDEGDTARVKHNFKSRAEEWLHRNYPDIFVNSEVVISWMTLGTNEYASFRVQYQLAGVHLNTKQLYEMAWQVRSIHNWWNRVKGRPNIPNMYPAHIDETSDYEKEYIPLQRVEFDPIEGPGVYQYEFDPVQPWSGLYDSLPVEYYLRMCYRLSLAKRQQAMRIIRNVDNESRLVVIADKSERETQAVARSFLIDEKLGYLRNLLESNSSSEITE